MSTDLSLKEAFKEWHGSYKSYFIGFTASTILTIISFSLVLVSGLTGAALAYSVTTLAVIQAAFQVIFFLHVGQEAKPRWETLVFYFMLLVLFIIAIGSLWIMYDLDERVMSGMDANMMKEMHHD